MEKSTDEHLRDIEKFIEEENLPNIIVSNELERYLNFSEEDLTSIPRDAIQIGIYILGQYSLSLQKDFNMLKGKIGYLETILNKTIVSGAQGYEFKNFEERKNLSIINNEFASKLHNIINELKLKLSLYTDMSSRVDSVAKSLNGLSFCKRDF